MGLDGDITHLHNILIEDKVYIGWTLVERETPSVLCCWCTGEELPKGWCVGALNELEGTFVNGDTTLNEIKLKC